LLSRNQVLIVTHLLTHSPNHQLTHSELPFLTDTKNDIRTSFFTISPNNRGLGTHSLTHLTNYSLTHLTTYRGLGCSNYSYPNGFPGLNPALYGEVRPVKVLVQLSEVVARKCATIDSVSHNYLHTAASDRHLDMDRLSEFRVSIFMETKVRNEKVIRNLIRIQSKYRMKKTCKRYHSERRRVNLTANSTKFTVIIQSFARMVRCKLLRLRACKCVKTLQNLYRMTIARRKYLRILNGITRVKARMKAWLVRKKHEKYIDKTFELYQEQLLLLWNTEHTSLVYRTCFWLKVSLQGTYSPTYSHLLTHPLTHLLG